MRALFVWCAVLLAAGLPVAVAANSAFLAYRDAVYIVAGFAGILGMVLLMMQPLLVGGYLPGLERARGRRAHLWGGVALLIAVVLHVSGLWVTSPPDVVDVLLFRSPTPFSIWGVLAMWAIFFAGLLALFRKRLGVPSMIWRAAHTCLVASAVVGTVAHALLIEGTMGQVSKTVLALLVLAATGKAIFDRRVWARLRRRV